MKIKQVLFTITISAFTAFGVIGVTKKFWEHCGLCGQESGMIPAN